MLGIEFMEDTMDIPGTQVAEMPNSDILLSWGKVTLVHKQAQFNSPIPGLGGNQRFHTYHPSLHLFRSPL